MGVIKKHSTPLAIAFIAVMFLVGATGAQAAMMNWTITTWNAQDGVDFTWDMDSKWDITGKEVDFDSSDLIIGSSGSDGVRVVGTIYRFAIPNFYDPLPKKTLDITLTGGNDKASGFDLARVIDVYGADSDYDDGGPALRAPGYLVDGTFTSTLVTERWHIFPNPDFEIVSIFAPAAFDLKMIEIVTESVPLPASVLLLGPAIFGLVLLRRRKKS